MCLLAIGDKSWQLNTLLNKQEQTVAELREWPQNSVIFNELIKNEYSRNCKVDQTKGEKQQNKI